LFLSIHKFNCFCFFHGMKFYNKAVLKVKAHIHWLDSV
jgi:hypothetical protein